MIIESPTFEYVRPKLTEYQLRALFGPERYAICEATTKAGKTAGSMVWLLEQAMKGRSGSNFWWVAPVSTQAKDVFDRVKRAIPPSVYQANEVQMTVKLANEAVIWFKSADKPNSLFGSDVCAAVIDEASRCKEESWYAVRSTLTATRGPIRIIGNVKGRRNWFYMLARRAESGDPDMSYAKITAKDAVAAGILSEREIEDAKSTMPSSVFRELFMAEPADDSGNPFGINSIHACIRKGFSKEATAAFGLDLAKSADWCVLIGLDRNGAMTYFDRWQGPWEMTIQKALAAVGRVPVMVDSTGAGDPVLEAMQRQGRKNYAIVHGYHFTSTSKQKLMEGLAVALQQSEVQFPDDAPPSRVVVSELCSFEYIYTRTGVQYSAPEGLHDDCVCSLALAWQQLTEVRRGRAPGQLPVLF